MNPPPDPEPGETPSNAWMHFALNVGLKLAETYGLGLTLFNAMRARFEDVSGSILGDITSTIGQAVRVATGLTTSQLNEALPMGDIPIVPTGWHQEDPADRVVAGVDVTGLRKDGTEVVTQRKYVSGLEDLTPNELIAAAEGLFVVYINTTDPEKANQIEEIISDLIFLGAYF